MRNHANRESDIPDHCPVASLPTAAPTRAAPSAVNVAVNGRTAIPTLSQAERMTATIKCRLALAYLHDLVEWQQGDLSRFTRMVGCDGKQIGEPDNWLRNLASICANPLVREAWPDLPAFVAGGLDAIGLKLPATGQEER